MIVMKFGGTSVQDAKAIERAAAIVKERLPDVPVTYFSDTGAIPYGKMSRRELVSRLALQLHLVKEGVVIAVGFV